MGAVAGLVWQKYGLTILWRHIATIHTIEGPTSGKVLIRFASLAGDSPYPALLDTNLSPGGMKGHPVQFRLTVKPYQIEQDKTIFNMMRWYKTWCKKMHDQASARGLDPFKVVPPHRFLRWHKTERHSNRPKAEFPYNADKTFSTYEELRAVMTPPVMEAYLLGAPPSTWIPPKEAATATDQQATQSPVALQQQQQQQQQQPAVSQPHINMQAMHKAVRQLPSFKRKLAADPSKGKEDQRAKAEQARKDNREKSLALLRDEEEENSLARSSWSSLSLSSLHFTPPLEADSLMLPPPPPNARIGIAAKRKPRSKRLLRQLYRPL